MSSKNDTIKVYMQDIGQTPTEIVLLRPRLTDQQASVALQRCPTASSLPGCIAVDIIQIKCLFMKEICQANAGAALERGIALKFSFQPTPALCG